MHDTLGQMSVRQSRVEESREAPPLSLKLVVTQALGRLLSKGNWFCPDRIWSFTADRMAKCKVYSRLHQADNSFTISLGLLSDPQRECYEGIVTSDTTIIKW